MTVTQMAIKKETINDIVIGNTNFKIELLSTIKSTEICFPMFSRNFIHSLPRDGVFPAHINGDHDHVSRYKSYCQKDKLG